VLVSFRLKLPRRVRLSLPFFSPPRRAVSDTPSTSIDSRCLLVGVTSVHDVFIFAPVKDPLSGMWTLVRRKPCSSCPFAVEPSLICQSSFASCQIDRLTPKLLASTDFPFRSAPKHEDDRETWHARRVLDAQTLCTSSLSLTSLLSLKDDPNKIRRPLHGMFTGLDWSSSLSFERDELEERSVLLDASLLALGHKGGLISFWRLVPQLVCLPLPQ
jgi:hypothetical protein